MIPVFKPLIEAEEYAAAHDALELGWLGMGSYVSEFETALHDLIGAPDRHVAAVSTGHAALHLALMLVGAGPGDEIITPSFNNIADFQAILATGAEPVFCDIDERTLCIDLAKAEGLVGPRTKAIIVMDYDCILCEHDAVAEFQRRHGIRVIHDAAHALGSKYKGRSIGSFSDITMFSFDPVKTVTCIDGGALVVRTREELEILHEMRLIGMGQPSSLMYQNQRAWTYDVKRLGFRYHMANLHAAIGVAQLKKFERISATRRETARWYNAHLADVPGVIVPQTDFEEVTPFLYYIRAPADRRDQLRAHLKEQGIDTGIHWQPGHWFSLLRNCRRGDLSVTDRVGREILSLPLHSSMLREDREAVVAGVGEFFSQTVSR
jgi:dTDP-4-amino-4,6-dideoxygalactose transaminase